MVYLSGLTQIHAVLGDARARRERRPLWLAETVTWVGLHERAEQESNQRGFGFSVFPAQCSTE